MVLSLVDWRAENTVNWWTESGRVLSLRWTESGEVLSLVDWVG